MADDIELREGMTVKSRDDEKVGELAALLIEEGEDEADFVLVAAAGKEHLLPFDAVIGVDSTDEALVVDATAEHVARYPALEEGADPSDAEMDLAWSVYEQTATPDA